MNEVNYLKQKYFPNIERDRQALDNARSEMERRINEIEETYPGCKVENAKYIPLTSQGLESLTRGAKEFSPLKIALRAQQGNNDEALQMKKELFFEEYTTYAELLQTYLEAMYDLTKTNLVPSLADNAMEEDVEVQQREETQKRIELLASQAKQTESILHDIEFRLNQLFPDDPLQLKVEAAEFFEARKRKRVEKFESCPTATPAK